MSNNTTIWEDSLNPGEFWTGSNRDRVDDDDGDDLPILVTCLPATWTTSLLPCITKKERGCISIKKKSVCESSSRFFQVP